MSVQRLLNDENYLLQEIHKAELEFLFKFVLNNYNIKDHQKLYEISPYKDIIPFEKFNHQINIIYELINEILINELLNNKIIAKFNEELYQKIFLD